jgi:hypothetical protein
MKKQLFVCIMILFSLGVNAQGNLKDKLKKSYKDRELHAPPKPFFYMKGLCFGDTTMFINKSDMGTITWAIKNTKGDTISVLYGDTVFYYFKAKGIYQVSLTADNGHKATLTKTVIVDSMTKADFAYRYCYNTWDNLSACSDQFIWVLPDGTTSTDTFPSYTFPAPGKFPVKLIAIRGNKKDTLTKIISIGGDSLSWPSAKFTVKKVGTATFEFKALDTLATYYSWYFGDKTSDDTSGYKVIHTIDGDKYQAPVDLMLVNACGLAFYDIDPFTVTKIEEYSDKTFSIFPNPNKGNFTIDPNTDETVEIIVTDIYAREIFKKKVMGKTHMNLPDLRSGVYFIKVIGKDSEIKVKQMLID